MRASFAPPNFAPEPIAVFAGESELKGCRAATLEPAGGFGEGDDMHQPERCTALRLDEKGEMVDRAGAGH